MRYGAITTAALIALSANAAQAKEPLRLEPSSPWVVDYADDSCALRRQFGDGPSSLILELAQDEPTRWFRTKLFGPLFRSRIQKVALRWEADRAADDLKVVTSFKTENDLFGVSFSTSLWPTIKDDRNDRDQASLDAEWESREKNSEALFIDKALDNQLQIATGSMAAPLAALRSCVDDLVHTWGLDPTEQRNLQASASPKDQESLFRMIMDPINPPDGVPVRMRLMISEDGAISNCKFIDTPASTSTSDKICRRVEKVRFDPAIDQSGTPINSFFVFSGFRIRSSY